MTWVTNPSALVDILPVMPPVSVAVGADIDTTTRIDMLGYEHIHVILHMGVSDTVPLLTCTHSSTPTGGTTSAFDAGAKTLTLAADDDGKAIDLELRCHGAQRYLNINLTTTGGAAGLFSIMAIGHKKPRSSELTSFGTEVASPGLT